MNKNEKIILFFLHNQKQLKDLTRPYTKQYQELLDNENSLFIDDIEKQYITILKWLLVKEILGLFNDINVEEAFVFVDGFNIKEYLK